LVQLSFRFASALFQVAVIECLWPAPKGDVAFVREAKRSFYGFRLLVSPITKKLRGKSAYLGGVRAGYDSGKDQAA
jgi:hypothetical protein